MKTKIVALVACLGVMNIAAYQIGFKGGRLSAVETAYNQCMFSNASDPKVKEWCHKKVVDSFGLDTVSKVIGIE